ncbi:MAG: hypothetical protein FWC51_00415 [Proteobacteria bacterium]|nr:hypothetical protein [Pseudomonadota bacterium]
MDVFGAKKRKDRAANMAKQMKENESIAETYLSAAYEILMNAPIEYRLATLTRPDGHKSICYSGIMDDIYFRITAYKKSDFGYVFLDAKTLPLVGYSMKFHNEYNCSNKWANNWIDKFNELTKVDEYQDSVAKRISDTFAKLSSRDGMAS